MDKITNVVIRMYCLGTGDCFILKFFSGAKEKFTMMIDCGSCQGTPEDFKPYIENLAAFTNNHVNLLVVTHEHNDHVNGFAKCEDIFKDKNFKIDEAWFAWTENPEDPGGKAAELQKKREKMKLALHNAIGEMKAKAAAFQLAPSNDFYKPAIVESHNLFLKGLDTMAEINLDIAGVPGNSLPGLVKIKAILKSKKTKVRYLSPGDIVTVDELPDIKFYVLGPPSERDFIFKEGKQGTDVYNKKLNFYESSLAANSFLNISNTDIRDKDIPFREEYIVNDKKPSIISSIASSNESMRSFSAGVVTSYNSKTNPDNTWRKIDDEWLTGAGSLALRLNSHINNTSLALAIEVNESKDVILFPGDAEYGSWESWHAIEKWKKKGPGGKHLVEDLLNRTIFYKVGHHLSYNGTALEKGIMMMESSKLAAMATLDRHRIASGWKSTMPNKFLMKELIKRCQGKIFIMDEFEIKDGPSKTLDPETLGSKIYESEDFPDKKNPIYIQYNCKC